VTDDGPITPCDGHDLPWLIGALIPSVTAMIDDIVEGFEDAVEEPIFARWCASAGHPPIPAMVEIAAAYLAGHEPPTNAEPVKAVMRGIRRRIGTAPERKAPATAKAIAGMLKRIPDAPPGLRDRALLLIGLSAALRRSEIVALNLADIAPRQAA
jgi:integrase